MGDRRNITVLCADYEHCQDLSGAFGDIEVTWKSRTTKFTFPLAFKRQAFEVSEFSLSNYIMSRDRGADWLTGAGWACSTASSQAWPAKARSRSAS